MPNITLVQSLDDIAHHNGRVVRFDCIISDMYEEEYFVGVLASNDQTAPPLIYKYFTNLTAH